MQWSEQTRNWLALICLIAAVLAFGKILDALRECVHDMREKFVVVKKRVNMIGAYLHVTTFYRYGMGIEYILDQHGRIMSNRLFRWERTKQGEIREVEQ
jgi:hypothetical protein